MNNFYATRQILNEKLVEIWAYNKHTSTDDKIRDARIKKLHFYHQLDSMHVLAEEEYIAYRRSYTRKYMEFQQKQRLLLKCRNLELKLLLNARINRIKKQQKYIYKKLDSSFNNFASIKEQVVEFQVRHYDIFKFHIDYFNKVIIY